MDLFSNDLSTAAPVLQLPDNDEGYLVVFNKRNHAFYDVMTLEDIDHYLQQGFDSRLFDIITLKQFKEMGNNLCVLMLDGVRAEISSFDELIGVYVKC